MQILSKKRYKFGDAQNHFITKGGMVIEECPDAFSKDPMFKLAVEDGTVLVIKGRGKAADEQVALALAEAGAEKLS